MTNLRKIMTEKIKHCHYLDYLYNKNGNTGNTRGTKADVDKYVKWLNTLDDRDFLCAYNRVYREW